MNKQRWVLSAAVGLAILTAAWIIMRPRSPEKRTLRDQVELGEKSEAKIIVEFSNGQLRVAFAEGKLIRWNCEVQGTASDPQKPFPFKGEAKLDLSDFEGVDCDLTLPAGLPAYFQGDSGLLKFAGVKSGLEAELGNGQIFFEALPFTPYRFQNSVKNGQTDEFPSSESEDSIPVRLALENGQLRYQGESKP